MFIESFQGVEFKQDIIHRRGSHRNIPSSGSASKIGNSSQSNKIHQQERVQRPVPSHRTRLDWQ